MCRLPLCDSCGFIARINSHSLGVLNGDALCNYCYTKYTNNIFDKPQTLWGIAPSYMMRKVQEESKEPEHKEKIGSLVCPHIACTGMPICKFEPITIRITHLVDPLHADILK